jgi:hypothetical protein
MDSMMCWALKFLNAHFDYTAGLHIRQTMTGFTQQKLMQQTARYFRPTYQRASLEEKTFFRMRQGAVR